MEDLGRVVDNLKIKRAKSQGYASIRPLLLVLPGGMRGTCGAGAMVALHELGLADAFDTVVGVSTGGPIGAYFLSGRDQAIQGASLYYTVCATPAFINLRRLRRVMDLDVLLAAMRQGSKAIDVDAICQSPTAFWVGATRTDGTPDLMNAKKAKPDIFAAIQASMTIPGVSGGPVFVDGQAYYDGGLNPFPIREVVAKFRPTDILVLPNICQRFVDPPRQRISDLSALVVLKSRSLALVQRALTRRKQFHESLQLARQLPNVRVGILWPEDLGIHELTTDANLLRQGSHDNFVQTVRTFGGTDVQVPLL